MSSSGVDATEQPVYALPNRAPTTTPEPMAQHEKSRLRAAAYRVERLYPGPMGELASREILMTEEFGYRFGNGSLMARLVDHIMKMPNVSER